MTRNGAIDIIVILMLIAMGLLGYLLGRGLPPEPSCADIIPFKHCINDNQCTKDVGFYIDYYKVKDRLPPNCPT